MVTCALRASAKARLGIFRRPRIAVTKTFPRRKERPGMTYEPQRGLLSTIPTPALVIDGGVVDRNVQRMATYVGTNRFRLRPHTKTHKSLFVASRQLAAGNCVGLTVAKTGEADVLRHASQSLLVAYPTVDEPRTTLAASLANDNDIIVAVDSSWAAERLSEAATRAGSTIGLLVDMDVGFHRTGVQGPIAAIALAEKISSLPGLALRGLFIYPGHVGGDARQQQTMMEGVGALVDETLDVWRQRGLRLDCVSGGSTPSAYHSHWIKELTEIRPGTYVYNDMNTVRGGYCGLDDCAARIVCTVVSDAVPGKVVLDGGSKTLTSDRCGPAPESGHGYLVEYPEAFIGRLTEEHAEVDVARCGKRPQVGERVTVIPNHICPCINLQDQVWWREQSNSDELIGLTVDARGRLS